MIDFQPNHAMSSPVTAGATPDSASFVPCGCRYEPQVLWFCINTEFHAEVQVLQALRKRGITTWLPEYLAPVGRILPLFPRYCFAQFDLAGDAWRYIYRTPGVVTILGTRNERPTPLPVRALEVLWAQCAPNGVIYPDQKPVRAALPAIPAGASVRVTAGALAGFEGICQRSTGERVSLLLTMLGGAVRTSAKRTDVEPIA